MGAGLTLCNARPQHVLEVPRVIVAEDLDLSARRAHAGHDRRVVECVRDDEAALANQSRDHDRVGGVAHAEDDSSLLADKGRDGLIQLNM